MSVTEEEEKKRDEKSWKEVEMKPSLFKYQGQFFTRREKTK